MTIVYQSITLPESYPEELKKTSQCVNINLRGWVLVTADADCTINSRQGPIAYFSTPTVSLVRYFGASSTQIEDDLSIEGFTIDNLNAAVQYLGVTTSATTKAGLISAINSHLNGD